MTEPRTPNAMRLWTVSIVALAVAFGIALQPANDQQRAGTGRATFIEKGCARCHAVYGHGPDGTRPRGGPDLGERKVYGTRLEIAADLWNHLPDMLKRMERDGVEPPSFSDEDVGAIIDYLSFLRYMDQPGNARTGRRLLSRKKCTSCHRLGGEGGDLGPDLTLEDTYVAPLDLATALWNHGPAMNDDFDRMDIERPEFGRRDILDIAAAIRSYITTSVVPAGAFQPGDRERGRELADAKYCTRCHAVRSVGGTLAPDFGDLHFDRSVTEIAGSMWNHGPAMWEIMREEQIPFPDLTRPEMADIIAFLYSLGLDDAPGDPGRGERLIGERRCTSCHAAGGVGATIAGDLAEAADLESPTAMVAAMWSHAAEMSEYAREERVRWPRLSGSEIQDIFAYIRSISGSGR